jgi:predicted molibdopterin-dependent oxidoreductase YjgC
MMPQLRIDNQTVHADQGSTLLEAAASVGIEIPTLCHVPGMPHYTSCMLCVVRETGSGHFIPACSATVSEGMLIETNSEPVRDARRAALELLLSDHTGDCEGPCQRACPANIDIPRLIRRIQTSDDNMEKSPRSGNEDYPLNVCRDCIAKHSPPPCERACRRGQHDEAVAIALLCQYAEAHLQDSGAEEPQNRPAFNSAMGRIQDDEWPIVMENVSDAHQTKPAAGTESGFTRDEAQGEAARCMHCDCRKPATCKLRLYAEEYGAKRTHFRTSSRRAFEHDLSHNAILFEQGKCIACGICTRITERNVHAPGLCLSGRGMDTRISAPLGKTIAEGLCDADTAAACVEACPTGALAWREGEDTA